jgi:survival of motor neuron protein-interacting protein 1
MKSEVFGQQPALPIESVSDEESLEDIVSQQVRQYLVSVRKEVYADELEVLAQAQNITNADHLETDQESCHEEVENGSDNGLDWSRSVVDVLLRLKERAGTSSLHDESNQPYDESVIIPETANEWRKLVMETMPPSIGFFYALDHSTVFKLVIYFTKWLSVSTNENLSRWIWLCFVRIDNLLDASEVSLLRDLAKKATRLIDKAHVFENRIASYTIAMVILVVGIYYGQRDMLDSLTRLEQPCCKSSME